MLSGLSFPPEFESGGISYLLHVLLEVDCDAVHDYEYIHPYRRKKIIRQSFSISPGFFDCHLLVHPQTPLLASSIEL
jgi:hypothetical protein